MLKMGLESLPHLALGNTKKGMTQIVMSPHGGSGEGSSNSQWLSDQKDEIKDQAYQAGRAFVAQHTKSMNKVCYDSHAYIPTIKSLEYFSEIRGLITPYRESLKLLTVKNPISFGATVFQVTKLVIGDLGARVSYYAPSKTVGLESAKKGMLIKDSFFIDYSANAAVEYADWSEQNLTRLNNVIASISYLIRELDEEALESNNPIVVDAVSAVLNLYHLFTKNNVVAGLTYTIIEDVWLNKKIPAARDLAPKMMELYDYAERKGIKYETPYPNYQQHEAELSIGEEMSYTTPKEHALYLEVFDHIKAKAVISTAGNRYQMGHLIPQNIYVNRLIDDLEVFQNQLEGHDLLDRLRLSSRC